MHPAAIGADEKSDRMKASVYLHAVGDEALEIYNNFMFDAERDKIKLEKIMGKLEAYRVPKRNVMYERHRFFTCVQKPGETVDQYTTELRNRTKTYDFGGLTGSLMKERQV